MGHNGAKLSGGQKQRLGIARAFLRDATLLIFDEPTAALDADSEREIKNSIAELKVGRISIVVAHRLSTIKEADKILFSLIRMKIESGSHQDLLNKKGRYYKMYKKVVKENLILMNSLSVNHELNEQQLLAVESTANHTSVLHAGAGSARQKY